ncbi:MAG: hypothetical protein HYR55_10035 [Acidobacteria bacterium]|nr:hypothetical protein [Acidobacteriota bacterium]MBI3658349.1 hypothetical protein [Acidobacteriota bacterium]
MVTISAQLVEETWRRIDDCGPDQGPEMVGHYSKSQPNIFEFMVEFTREIQPESTEFALYMSYVIWQVFDAAYGKAYPVILPEEIIAAYETNEVWVQQHDGLDDIQLYERLEADTHLRQVNLVISVLDALFAPMGSEDPDEINIPEEDKGYLFLLMKTIIDALDKKIVN